MINDDVEFYYSGNGIATGSLGGAIHANSVSSSVNENLFADIDAAEALAGGDKYRCLYLKNNGIVSYNVAIYISTPTPSNETIIYIGKGDSVVGGLEQTIVDETTEPNNIIWLHREQDYNAATIATLAVGEHQAIWFKLAVSVGASGNQRDYFRTTLKEV